MGCGCNKKAAPIQRWKWISSDGRQTVKGLTETRAKTRVQTKGGTASPE